MPIVTPTEKVVVIFVMLIGVIGFSLASGALTNFISKSDQRSAEYEAKMGVLEKLSANH